MINVIHFLTNTLTVVWFIGGLLLLPFNSAILGGFVGGKYKIEQDRWWRICRPIWALQMVWNLIFFSASLSFRNIEEGGKAKEITYTLTRGRPHLVGGLEGSEEYPPIYRTNPEEWDWHFYRETAKGKKEIDDFSEEATPFQKAIHDTTFHASDDSDNTSLDYRGLHVSSRSNTAEKWYAFDQLPYEEATAYIDHLNTARLHEYTLGENILYSLFLAAICPFFPMLIEVFGPILLLTCLAILGIQKIKSIGK